MHYILLTIIAVLLLTSLTNIVYWLGLKQGHKKTMKKPDAYGVFSTDLHILKTWATEKRLNSVIKKVDELQTLLNEYEKTNREDKS